MDSPQSTHLWNEAADALIVADPGGTILSWNTAAEALFGYSSTEAIGRSLRELLADDGSAQPADNPCVFEAPRRRKDGSLIHVNVARHLVSNAAGRPDHIVY